MRPTASTPRRWASQSSRPSSGRPWAAPTAGWTKHVFYDTGDGGWLALWDLHLTDLNDDDWRASISTGLGLPWWINHLAFGVADLDALEERKQHWLAAGLKVSEVDHDFIRSIYTRDPDGNLVEFTTTRACSTKPTASLPLRSSPTTSRHWYPTTPAPSTSPTAASSRPRAPSDTTPESLVRLAERRSSSHPVVSQSACW